MIRVEKSRLKSVRGEQNEKIVKSYFLYCYPLDKGIEESII